MRRALLATVGSLSLSACILRPTLTDTFGFRPQAMGGEGPAPADWGWPSARLDTMSRADSAAGLLAWWGPVQPGTSRCGGVLLLHGKGKNRAQMLPLGRTLQAAGFSVLLPDYRGYGGNIGRPTTEGVHDDAALAYRHLRTRLGDSLAPVIIIGHSMGTALAARLTRAQRPTATIYISPFARISSLVRSRAGMIGPRLFDTTTFAFNPLEDAAQGRSRVMVVVAGRDLLIRQSESDAFIAGLARPPAVVRDPAASHDGILKSESILRVVGDSARAWSGCSVASHRDRGV